MPVNIDTVYQRVLALANKEQRGYITPLEFNLFANQAQQEIFEQYFYDLNQAERAVGNSSQYNDPIKILLEKIQPFERRHQPVRVLSKFNSYLPDDVYRLGEVIWYGGGNYPGAKVIEEITERELIEQSAIPLAAPNQSRPVFCRAAANVAGVSELIRIAPYSDFPALQVALFFTQNGDIDGDATAAVDTGGNFGFIEPGQVVTGAGIPAFTTVVSIVAGAGGLVLSNAATATTSDVTLTFASDDIKCNYIRKPIDAEWGYEEIEASDGQSGSTALYNNNNSQNFELHASEENELVLQILKLAGVNIQDPGMIDYSSSEQQFRIQQEKS